MPLINDATKNIIKDSIKLATDEFLTDLVVHRTQGSPTRNSHNEIINRGGQTDKNLNCLVKKKKSVDKFGISQVGKTDEDKLELIFDAQYLTAESVLTGKVLSWKKEDIFLINGEEHSIEDWELAGWFKDQYMIVKVIVEKSEK